MGPSEPTLPGSARKSYIIPKLGQDGSNWITWKIQTLTMLAVSWGVMQHIEGTDREPLVIPTFLASPVSWLLMQEEEECLERAEKWWDKYHQCKAMVNAQIFMTVPESLLVELCKLKIVKVMWDAVCAKHEGKALTVKVDLWCHICAMKCEDKSQVWMRLESLMRMQEQLIGMAAGLADTDLV